MIKEIMNNLKGLDFTDIELASLRNETAEKIIRNEYIKDTGNEIRYALNLINEVEDQLKKLMDNEIIIIETNDNGVKYYNTVNNQLMSINTRLSNAIYMLKLASSSLIKERSKYNVYGEIDRELTLKSIESNLENLTVHQLNKMFERLEKNKTGVQSERVDMKTEVVNIRDIIFRKEKELKKLFSEYEFKSRETDKGTEFYVLDTDVRRVITYSKGILNDIKVATRHISFMY